MANLTEPGFVSGIDESLATVDVYGRTTADIFENIGDSNLSSLETNRNIKQLDRNNLKVKKPYVPNNDMQQVDTERLVEGIDEISDDVKALLHQDSFTDADFQDKRQNDILEAGGLIEKNSRGSYKVNKVLSNAKTDLKSLQDDCALLFNDLVRKSNDDWGSKLLLYLEGLYRLLVLGVACQIGNLINDIENPYIKESVLLLGVGAFFKDSVKGLKNDRLLKSPITDNNRFNRSTSTSVATTALAASTVPLTSFKNDYTNTPLTTEESKLINGKLTNEYLDSDLTESELEIVNTNLVGYRENLSSRTISDKDSVKGLDIDGLITVGGLVEPYKVLDLYPNLGFDILKYYRIPNVNTLDLNLEYLRLTTVMDMYIPNWATYSETTGSLKYFNSSGYDALTIFIDAPDSIYKEEALIAKSYFRNDVRKLLKVQYPSAVIE